MNGCCFDRQSYFRETLWTLLGLKMANAEASLQLEHEGLLSQFQLERAESQACAINREMVGW